MLWLRGVHADAAHLGRIEVCGICLLLMRAIPVRELQVEVLTTNSFCKVSLRARLLGVSFAR